MDPKRYVSQPGSFIRRSAVLVETNSGYAESGFVPLGSVKITLICDVRPTNIPCSAPARDRYLVEASFNVIDGKLVLGGQGGVIDRRMLASPYRVMYAKDGKRLVYGRRKGFFTVTTDPVTNEEVMQTGFRVNEIDTRYRTKEGSRLDPEFREIRSPHFVVWEYEQDLIRRIERLEQMIDNADTAQRRCMSIRDVLPTIYAAGVQHVEFDRSEVDAQISRILANPKADMPGSRAPLGTVKVEVLLYENKKASQFFRCYKEDKSFIDIPADGRSFRPTFEGELVCGKTECPLLFTFINPRPMDINTFLTYEGSDTVMDHWFSLLSSHETVDIDGNNAVNYRMLTSESIASAALFMAGTGSRELFAGMLIDEPTRLVETVLPPKRVVTRPDSSRLLMGESGNFSWDLRFFETMLSPDERIELRKFREAEESHLLPTARNQLRHRNGHGVRSVTTSFRNEAGQVVATAMSHAASVMRAADPSMDDEPQEIELVVPIEDSIESISSEGQAGIELSQSESPVMAEVSTDVSDEAEVAPAGE